MEKLCKFGRNELIESLKNPDYKDMKLIREISRITSAERRARTNPSFASKFCHYAWFYIFEGTEHQDNYLIYNGILKAVLPLYLEYFGIDQKFDHLLWYYHKGRL